MHDTSVIRPPQTLQIVDVGTVYRLLDPDVENALPGLVMTASSEKIRAISDWILLDMFKDWLIYKGATLSGHYRYDDARLVKESLTLPFDAMLTGYFNHVFTDPGKFNYTAMISGTSLIVSKELKQ